MEVDQVEDDDDVKQAMDETLADLNFQKNEVRRLKNLLHAESMGKLAMTRKYESVEQEFMKI
jgi:hypothetical protein